jgi:hypothetical protein
VSVLSQIVPGDTTVPSSRAARWTGRTMSGLAILFLVFDGLIKLDPNAPVEEAFAQLGVPLASAARIGLLELLCVLAYALPWTSTLGAVLLTGFLGGAIAIHVRVGDPLWSHVLFPAYVGVLVWAGLILREDRLRALLRPRMAAQRVTRQHAAAARGAAR